MDINKIRNDFPVFRENPNLAYLDSAAMALKPDAVIEAVDDYYNKLGVKVSLKNYNGKYFDLPVIYGTDMLNGKLIDELYILKQPTEVEDPTGIVELRQNATDDNMPVYNLQGQRVSPTAKGLLICGGHKWMNR